MLWISSNTLVFGNYYRAAGASVGAARILRFIKVLRSMKSVKALKVKIDVKQTACNWMVQDKLTGVSLVIDTIITTIPELFFLCILAIILSILFIILGGELFGQAKYIGKYFSDFVEGLFTTFIVLTQVRSFNNHH